MRMPFLADCALGSVVLGYSEGLRGIRKSDNERDPREGSPVRASASETSLSVALENHLNPSRR